MPPKRLLGIVLLVVGLFLLYFGLRATDSIGESIQEGLTGKFSDETTWFLVGGAVAIVVGAALALLPGRTRMA
jgi:uncharacterized membrane protein